MMDIFESLENSSVSEECFDEIMGIVENILSAINKSDKSEEKKDELWNKALKARQDEYVWSNLFRKRDPRFKSDNVEIRYTTNKDNDDGRTQKKRDSGKEFKFSKGGRPIYTRNGEIVDMEECFNDIMELVEGMLAEGTNLEKVVIRARKVGKVDSDKSGELRARANSIPGTNDVHFSPSGETVATGNPYKEDAKKMSPRNYKSTHGRREADEDQIYKSIDKNLRKNNPGTGPYDNLPSSSQFRKVNKYIKQDNPDVNWKPKNKGNY